SHDENIQAEEAFQAWRASQPGTIVEPNYALNRVTFNEDEMAIILQQAGKDSVSELTANDLFPALAADTQDTHALLAAGPEYTVNMPNTIESGSLAAPFDMNDDRVLSLHLADKITYLSNGQQVILQNRFQGPSLVGVMTPKAFVSGAWVDAWQWVKVGDIWYAPFQRWDLLPNALLADGKTINVYIPENMQQYVNGPLYSTDGKLIISYFFIANDTKQGDTIIFKAISNNTQDLWYRAHTALSDVIMPTVDTAAQDTTSYGYVRINFDAPIDVNSIRDLQAEVKISSTPAPITAPYTLFLSIIMVSSSGSAPAPVSGNEYWRIGTEALVRDPNNFNLATGVDLLLTQDGQGVSLDGKTVQFVHLYAHDAYGDNTGRLTNQVEGPSVNVHYKTSALTLPGFTTEIIGDRSGLIKVSIPEGAIQQEDISSFTLGLKGLYTQEPNFVKYFVIPASSLSRETIGSTDYITFVIYLAPEFSGRTVTPTLSAVDNQGAYLTPRLGSAFTVISEISGTTLPNISIEQIGDLSGLYRIKFDQAVPADQIATITAQIENLESSALYWVLAPEYDLTKTKITGAVVYFVPEYEGKTNVRISVSGIDAQGRLLTYTNTATIATLHSQISSVALPQISAPVATDVAGKIRITFATPLNPAQIASLTAAIGEAAENTSYQELNCNLVTNASDQIIGVDLAFGAERNNQTVNFNISGIDNLGKFIQATNTISFLIHSQPSAFIIPNFVVDPSGNINIPANTDAVLSFETILPSDNPLTEYWLEVSEAGVPCPQYWDMTVSTDEYGVGVRFGSESIGKTYLVRGFAFTDAGQVTNFTEQFSLTIVSETALASDAASASVATLITPSAICLDPAKPREGRSPEDVNQVFAVLELSDFAGFNPVKDANGTYI
ncbi:MAG: hypothetical protein COV73_01640, partial [Candidatus Omnitrophica bacterium CG11_big_fil_rev_8_21_14_0_20_43_6]